MPLLPAGYIERLNTITDIEADPTGSAQGRWTDYQVAARLVAANPIVGVGLGQDILALDRVTRSSDLAIRSQRLSRVRGGPRAARPAVVLWLLVASFSSARRVERRTATEPALRDLASSPSGVRIALVAFAVAAFFHPIAYQFYFFCVAGLAVALQERVCRGAERASPELAR